MDLVEFGGYAIHALRTLPVSLAMSQTWVVR